jgi:hypothetical protein
MAKRMPKKLLVPPSGFYTMARENLRGAKRIASTLATEAEKNSDPCIQFLLGWTAEGFLKTFLAAREIPERVLRNKIGHDLLEAYEQAISNGLHYPDLGRLHVVVGHLADAHLEMHWRYMPINPDGSEMKFKFVWPSLAIPALDALDHAVWPFVEADFTRTLEAQGLLPHSGWCPVGG